ncbi:MAG: rhodanese-like domain-containing protein [Coleofasciculaceae cyanobacterium SM2_1_6]|nr:rhodanese-like domain-containing protein [Coleofasciculaceae cyanobacterium SM2_1_6]
MTTDQMGVIQEINAATLQNWLNENQVTLLDIREPGEYAGEKIAGAKLVALSKFNLRDIRLLEEQNQKQIVLYCQSGNRSGIAANKLLNAGFDQVIHLQGGLNNWKQAGYPTEISRNAPISIMRQVQIVAGTLVFTGTILGVLVSPWFLILSGFVGAGLIFSGVSGTCAMGMLLAKLPYNQ